MWIDEDKPSGFVVVVVVLQGCSGWLVSQEKVWWTEETVRRRASTLVAVCPSGRLCVFEVLPLR